MAHYYSTESPTIGLAEILDTTLDSYEGQDPASWKGQLYAAKESVIIVALADRKVQPRFAGRVRVLDFGPEDQLWDARVHL